MPNKIVIMVKEIKGTCPHKVGDQVEILGDRVKGNLCPMAFHAIYPYVFALQNDAIFPWEKDKDRMLAVCPDQANIVTFEIMRVKIRD